MRRFITNGQKMAHTLSTSPMFALTEPTEFPTAISLLPESVAKTDTVISGSVVAKLTSVAPIITFGMPDFSAIQTAESTNMSPPFIIKISPIENSKMSIKMFKATSCFVATNLGIFRAAKQLVRLLQFQSMRTPVQLFMQS